MSTKRKMLADIEAGLAKLKEPIPGRIFGVSLFDRTWATCFSPHARETDDAAWLHPLPGIVALRDKERQLLDVRATEDVGGLVKKWRAVGAYQLPGVHLTWLYCVGEERIRVLLRCGVKLADRELEDIRRATQQSDLLHKLNAKVVDLAHQLE